MNRTPLNSSAVKSAGYANGVIEIELPSGVYRYPGTQEDFDALMASDSKGKHFGARIRPLGGVRVEPEAEEGGDATHGA